MCGGRLVSPQQSVLSIPIGSIDTTGGGSDIKFKHACTCCIFSVQTDWHLSS